MQKDSLVIHLQKKTFDPTISLTDLLREAYAVAKKLDIKDFFEWVLLEQNGYSKQKVPNYRKLTGELKALNPYVGFIPVILPSSEMDDIVTTKPIIDPVSEIENMIRIAENKGDTVLMITIPLGMERDLNNRYADELNQMYLKMYVHIQITQFIRILDAVRNQILNWAIELEKKGVFGHDLLFTQEEKKAASTINYNIEIKEMVNSQIQQATTSSLIEANIAIETDSIDNFVREFEEKLSELVMSNDDLKTIEADIETLKAQLKSAKPKSRIVNECFTSIRHILEGMAGNAAAIYLLSVLPNMS